MKKTSYKGKTPEALLKELVSKREAVRSFRFGSAGSKTRNVKEGKNAKKDIARILTELNSKTQ